jgi:putative glutamine amidotransferase
MAVSDRPLVGVTGPDRGGLIAWCMTALALRRSGAIPLRITPGREFDEASLDALVIGGGSDVDPFHYGEESLPGKDNSIHSSLLDWLIGLALSISRAIFARHSIQDYDPQRDQLEKRLIQYALYQDKPILGICRGAQLMNVALGGSLHQDIGHFYSEDAGNIRSILPRKTVLLTGDTQLRRILGKDKCAVNALHDQSIKQLGDDIVVSAAEANGVIQGIEKQEHVYFIGVQWHPEYIPQSKTQQRLFHRLARLACEQRAVR